jgi:hypothetical protein
VRDQCVWRPESNIEETMNVMVRYDKFKRVSDKRAGAWSALVRIVA